MLATSHISLLDSIHTEHGEDPIPVRPDPQILDCIRESVLKSQNWLTFHHISSTAILHMYGSRQLSSVSISVRPFTTNLTFTSAKPWWARVRFRAYRQQDRFIGKSDSLVDRNQMYQLSDGHDDQQVGWNFRASIHPTEPDIIPVLVNLHHELNKWMQHQPITYCRQFNSQRRLFAVVNLGSKSTGDPFVMQCG